MTSFQYKVILTTNPSERLPKIDKSIAYKIVHKVENSLSLGPLGLGIQLTAGLSSFYRFCSICSTSEKCLSHYAI
jgi:hypothetical protein